MKLLPPLDDHVDVAGLELEGEASAPEALGRDERRPGSGERLEHRVALVVPKGAFHALDRLLRPVSVPVVVPGRDLPERRLRPVVGAVALPPAPHCVPARLVLRSGSRRDESAIRSFAQTICARMSKPAVSREACTRPAFTPAW